MKRCECCGKIIWPWQRKRYKSQRVLTSRELLEFEGTWDKIFEGYPLMDKFKGDVLELCELHKLEAQFDKVKEEE